MLKNFKEISLWGGEGAHKCIAFVYASVSTRGEQTKKKSNGTITFILLFRE